MDSSIISIIIVLITMGFFVWNRLPISVVAILGSVAMAMFIPEMDLSAVDVYKRQALGKLDAQKYIVNRDGYIYDGKLNSRLYKLCSCLLYTSRCV